MYVYFDKKQTLKTVIDHGEKVRQGSNVLLTICLDKDFFEYLRRIRGETEEFGDYHHWNMNVSLVKSNGTSIALGTEGSDDIGEIRIFTKLIDSEVTYNLIDGEEYIMYDFNLASEVATNDGLDFDIIPTLNYGLDDVQETITLARIDVHVEKTYGFVCPKITTSQYATLLNKVNEAVASAMNKLDKRTTTGHGAYVNIGGTDYLQPVTINATGETIVQRTANGRIKAATPSENDDVVIKSYLESYVSSDLVKKTDTSDTATAGKVPKWNANGNIQTGTPTNNNEAANKGYVDTNFVKTSDRSTTPAKGKVAQYSNDKTLQSEAPTLDKEVANKKYVDDAISALPQAIYEDTVVEDSPHPVKSSGLYTAFQSKADLVNGRVPVSQLPSYVDDVQNITTIGVVYPHISSLPVDGLYDGLILLCIGTNPNATDLEYATASQWSNGFLIKYVVDHWQLYDTLQPHKIYVVIDTNRAYRFTMSGDTHLTEIGGVGNLLPEIIITLQQMISETSATLTQSQANYIEDDTIGVFYISLPNGMEGYVYKNDKSHLYFNVIGAYADTKYIIEYDSATKVIAITNMFSTMFLFSLESNENEEIELYYQNNSGDPTYLRSNDKFLVATKEQTFTSEEKAQLWANLGLENLDEEDF